MSKRTFYGFISFILVIVLCACAWLIGWKVTGELNPLAWVKNTEEPIEKVNPEESSFLVSARYNAGDLATFAATPYANDGNSVYLTLLTDPIETDDIFEWSSSDTSSVIVEPDSSGRSATVTCLQAFSEQILVKATSEQTGIEAVATCDFVKRAQAVELKLAPEKISFGPTSNVYTVEAEVTYGKGTITPTVTLTNGVLHMTYEGNNRYQIYGFEDEENAEGRIYEARMSDYKFSGNTLTISDASSLMEFSLTDTRFNSQLEYYKTEAAQKLNSRIKANYSAGITTAEISIDYSITYGGTLYSSGSLNGNFAIDITNILTYSTQSSFNRPSVIF